MILVCVVRLPLRVQAEKTEDRNEGNPPLHQQDPSAPLDQQQLKPVQQHCSAQAELVEGGSHETTHFHKRTSQVLHKAVSVALKV